jgi:hypothetical protein
VKSYEIRIFVNSSLSKNNIVLINESTISLVTDLWQAINVKSIGLFTILRFSVSSIFWHSSLLSGGECEQGTILANVINTPIIFASLGYSGALKQ